MFSHILYASDGSDHAIRAGRAAAQIAARFGSRVTVLHVFNLPVAAADYALLPGVELDAAVLAQIGPEIQDAVERRSAKPFEEAGVACSLRGETGHPPDVITRVARDEGCDLIVLGSHGLGGLRSLLMGSTSDRVAHHAHCPVLVVK